MLRLSNLVKRFYHPNVIDHYENPRNMGSLDKTDKNVGSGLVGAPACGDVMKIQIKVNICFCNCVIVVCIFMCLLMVCFFFILL